MVKADMLTMLGKDRTELSNLPKINPLKLQSELEKLVDALNNIPEVPPAYQEKWENK